MLSVPKQPTGLNAGFRGFGGQVPSPGELQAASTAVAEDIAAEKVADAELERETEEDETMVADEDALRIPTDRRVSI